MQVFVNDIPYDVTIKPSSRAKRYTLRLNERRDEIIMTVPIHYKDKHIDNLITKAQPWLEKKLNAPHEIIQIGEGVEVPIFGDMQTIKYRHDLLAKVRTENPGELIVTGFDPKVIPGTLTEFLTDQLLSFLHPTCMGMADTINKEVAQVRISDTKRQWGSCSHNGRLSFTWRLVFAPKDVIRYVCAHEVAHLIELNHSAAFWAIVEDLIPDYKNHILWLKQNGHRLFTYTF
jgi:hypothetical protein